MLYVFAQFLFLAILAWPLETVHFSFLGSMLMISGAVIAMLALFANRPGNFNVRPVPKLAGELITTGIYRFIRHPMYSSLLCVSLGMLFCQFSVLKLIAAILLVLTLAFKARYEERALLVLYPEYKDYQKTTKAFIPLLW